MSLLPPGSRIGRFEISRVLGEGAMGIVYLAHDPQIERPVAIKTLRPQGGGGSDEELKERFLKEAKLAGRLQHPNVVTIYEAGQDGDTPYIAMEYVDGEALGRYLSSRGVLTLRERIEVVREVALALEHAHSRGVLHRDVKPGNILLTRDRRVKVADFGIGKLLSGSGDMTRTGQMIGSPAYMSPEQIRGEKLDGRSDFFSLGVVFYELLTGARPFPGDSITTLVYQILHTEPRDPLEIRADLPVAAREVFAKLLAKSPDKRPADAREFLAETSRIADRIGEAEQTVAFSGAGEAAAALAAASLPLPRPPSFSSAATGSAVPPVAATATASATATPTGVAQPARGLLYLFGTAALLLAIAIFLFVWNRRPAPSPAPVASVSTRLAPTAVVSAAAIAALSSSPSPPSTSPSSSSSSESPVPVVTVGALPTPGPPAAADAVVGAPRYNGPAPTRAPRAVPTPRVAAAPTMPAEPTAEPRPVREPGGERVADNVYRTRRFAKFGVSPDQARMYVDGRYVGIADDWDDRGGGRKFEFLREGTHRVRFELPGHRDLNVDVLVSSGADDDTADVGDELKRESRVLYPKLAAPTEHTTGPVVFDVIPPAATIIENGRTLGPASSFGPSNPLKLSGPMVHDIVVSAPGHKARTIRILVAGNADSPLARVKVELKRE